MTTDSPTEQDDRDDGGVDRSQTNSGDTTTMSDSVTKFQVEIDEETTLCRDDLVEHVDYGPMVVGGIRVGPSSKTVELKSELGTEALDLSGDEVRKQWGEELHFDPVALYEGTFRATNEAISVDGLDVEMSVTTEGDENIAETVHMHALDQAVRAMQAMRDEEKPENTEGAGFEIDWETVFEEESA